jgi:hypothetical protein
MPGALLTFLSGVAVGTAPVLLWELGLKPWRERRSLARVLRAEIEANVQSLARLEAMRVTNPGYPVPGYRAAAHAYGALVTRLGDLPDEVLEEMLDFYLRMQQVQTELESLLEHDKEYWEAHADKSDYRGLPAWVFDPLDTAILAAEKRGFALLQRLDDLIGLPLDHKPRPSLDAIRERSLRQITRRKQKLDRDTAYLDGGLSPLPAPDRQG